MRLGAFLICGLLSATSVFSTNRVICVTQSSAKNEIPAGARVVSTLQKGIDLAGRYKQRGDSVILLIAGGTYTLDKTLEMTSLQLGDGNSRLVVRPLNGEKVVLYGGKEVSTQYIEAAPLSEIRIQPGLHDKIVKVDLRNAGVTSIGKLRHAGFLRPAIPAWTEVFVNDQVQKLSRWPNDTSALMGKVIETGSIPRVEDFSNKGGTFEYYGDRPSRWKSGDTKWIAGYFAHGYADDMVQIAKIDTTKKTIQLAEAVMYGLISGSDLIGGM